MCKLKINLCISNCNLLVTAPVVGNTQKSIFEDTIMGTNIHTIPYSCSLEIESISHYLLRCPFYTHIRKTLLDNITNLIGDISNFSDDELTNLLLYGDNIHSIEVNSSIIKNTLIFLKSSERFGVPLL